jgi:outer membrane protein OmpA-like peptidoglycan-associated protein
MGRGIALSLTAVLAFTAGACTEGRPTGTTVDRPGTTAPSPPDSAPATEAPGLETRTVDAAGDRLSMTMTPLIRSGTTVVLSVPTRLDRAADGTSSVVTRHFSSILATSFDNVRLVDRDSRRVYLVADGADGHGCTCTGLQSFQEGETRPLQAAFTGVPESVTRLSVMLPYAGVFFDVPVTGGVVPEPPPSSGPSAQEPLDLTTAGASYAADLDAYTERLGLGVSTKRTPRRLDISLDTDVLFRVDSARLTAQASRSLAAAVRDLRDSAPGPLSVTGHTDDTGTAAHNQTLSEQRARSVAAALGRALPAAQWPMTVTGKGETEPAAAGTSAAVRRLNRRVTISHQAAAQQPGEADGEADGEDPGEPPRATGVTGTAAGGAEVALPLGRGTIRFTPGTATVHGPFLQVDLIATNIGDRDATILDYLGQGVFTARDEFDPYARFGASGVRLLDGATATYGLDYVAADGGHRCLCDRILNQAIPPGSAQTVALWFPAPAPGTTAVTLDVPDRMRITEVPVG